MVTEYGGKGVQTLVPEVVTKIMQRRAHVKGQMKKCTDPALYETLNTIQLTMKTLQNAIYGYCGSQTSGMTLTCLAATVCAIAQYQNRTVLHLARSRHVRVIYGDTDSVFLFLFVYDIHQCYIILIYTTKTHPISFCKPRSDVHM
jgi:DNA polymerase elongation subunit (family B)